jgi:hypothetical protein
MNGLSSPPVSSTANTGFVTESNSSRENPREPKDFVQSGGFCEVAGLSRAAGRRGERDLIEAGLNEAAAVLKILAAGCSMDTSVEATCNLNVTARVLLLGGK